MKASHLYILQHSLGCDNHGRPTPLGRQPNHDDEFGCYRNRYVTSPTSQAGEDCQHLTSIGYMFDYGPQSVAGGMHYYAVSQAGYDAMRAASPPPPKLSKSAQRYQAFRDLDFGWKFGEYLNWKGRKNYEQRCGI